MLRLSERLNLLGADDAHTKHEASLNIAASLRNYLQKVLKTKQGGVVYAPDMGLSPINMSQGINSDDEKLHVLMQIEALLLKFDARIESISTQLKRNHSVTIILSFQMLVTTQSNYVVSLLGTLQSDGTFELELQ